MRCPGSSQHHRRENHLVSETQRTSVTATSTPKLIPYLPVPARYPAVQLLGRKPVLEAEQSSGVQVPKPGCLGSNSRPDAYSSCDLEWWTSCN